MVAAGRAKGSEKSMDLLTCCSLPVEYASRITYHNYAYLPGMRIHNFTQKMEIKIYLVQNDVDYHFVQVLKILVLGNQFLVDVSSFGCILVVVKKLVVWTILFTYSDNISQSTPQIA